MRAKLGDGVGHGAIVGGRARRAQRDVEPDHHGPGAGYPTEDAGEIVAGQRLAASERVEGRVIDGHDDEARGLAGTLKIDEEVEGAGLERFEIAHG